MFTVVAEAYRRGFSVASDFARGHIAAVAAAASMGLITTLEKPGQYGRRWRPTHLGIDYLFKEYV